MYRPVGGHFISEDTIIMDNRSRRTDIFKILFQTEFQSGVDIEELVSLYCETNTLSDEDPGIIINKLNSIMDNLETIDSRIEASSKDWKLERLGKAELAILRLSVYEILFEEGNEDAITADEAVRLAKKYASEKASKFINGILGTIIRNKHKESQ